LLRGICGMGRPVERSPGETAIVVTVWNEPPPLAGLAADIGLASFPLGIERREGKIEIMLARFAGIDGAARELCHGIVHGVRSLGIVLASSGCRGVTLGQSRQVHRCDP